MSTIFLEQKLFLKNITDYILFVLQNTIILGVFSFLDLTYQIPEYIMAVFVLKRVINANIKTQSKLKFQKFFFLQNLLKQNVLVEKILQLLN